MIAATQTTSCFITQLSRLLLSLNICTVNAEAGISLSQLGRDRHGWSLLWARLLRILLVSCAIFFFFITDTLLASQLLRGNEGAYPFISYTFSLMTVFALWFVSRDVYTMAYAAVPQQGLSTSTPPTLSLWAHLSRIGSFLRAAIYLCQLTSFFMALVGFSYVYDQNARSIVLYTTVVIQIAVLVFLILGGKQALVFFVGEQYVSPLQAASALSIEGGGGSSDRNGDVSVASLSTTTTTSAVTAPVNMLSSMRSALSGIAASLSTPSASVADGAYSALSAEDSVHGLHSSMVVVTGVPVHAPVAGQREGSTNII